MPQDIKSTKSPRVYKITTNNYHFEPKGKRNESVIREIVIRGQGGDGVRAGVGVENCEKQKQKNEEKGN